MPQVGPQILLQEEHMVVHVVMLLDHFSEGVTVFFYREQPIIIYKVLIILLFQILVQALLTLAI